jgi:type IV secretory pathway protease TraF
MYLGDPTHRRRAVPWTGLVACSALVLTLVSAGRRLQRVVVAGASMEPTLTAGDRLLVLAGVPLRVGAVVAVEDPRRAEQGGVRRVMVKRIAAVGPEGVDVRGDAPARSTDSRTFGPVPPRMVQGTVIWRYAPPERAGRVTRVR